MGESVLKDLNDLKALKVLNALKEVIQKSLFWVAKEALLASNIGLNGLRKRLFGNAK